MSTTEIAQLTGSSTVYDDVFRTQLNDFPQLIIPYINIIFGTSYTNSDQPHLGNNEIFFEHGDGKSDKLITDSSIHFNDQYDLRYHIECQSTVDNKMLLRMSQYGTVMGFNARSNIHDDYLEINIPRQAILYLRSNSNTPDELFYKINTSEGSILHKVHVDKMEKYSLDYILDNNLLFLLPFYIFNLEKLFKSNKNTSDYMKHIEDDYAKISTHLNNLTSSSTIDIHTQKSIIDFIKRVVNKLAEKQTDVKKGVENIMGGKIIDYEAKTIFNKGISQGINKGISQGIMEGEANGILKEKINSAKNFIKAGLVSLEQLKNMGTYTDEELAAIAKP